jgi:hypothetical protein
VIGAPPWIGSTAKHRPQLTQTPQHPSLSQPNITINMGANKCRPGASRLSSPLTPAGGGRSSRCHAKALLAHTHRLNLACVGLTALRRCLTRLSMNRWAWWPQPHSCSARPGPLSRAMAPRRFGIASQRRTLVGAARQLVHRLDGAVSDVPRPTSHAMATLLTFLFQAAPARHVPSTTVLFPAALQGRAVLDVLESALPATSNAVRSAVLTGKPAWAPMHCLRIASARASPACQVRLFQPPRALHRRP